MHSNVAWTDWICWLDYLMKFSSPRVLLEDEPYFHLWQKYRVKNAEQTPLTTLYVENLLQEIASKFSLLLPKRVVLHSKSSFSFIVIVSEWKNMFFFFSILEKIFHNSWSFLLLLIKQQHIQCNLMSGDWGG